MGTRSRSLALIAIALIPLAGSTPLGAQIETGADAVRADKTGWWNSLQGIESGTPLAPIGGVYPGFPQQATGVPVGAFASSISAGGLDKVSAVGIIVDAPMGATVEEFTMTITESADPAANNGSSPVAAITACPITAFWAEAENARFNGRPEADCELGATPGQRDAAGKWTFDLKAYGQAILDPLGTLGQNGVLLMPTGAAPETFQVTWAGLASETPPTFTFKASGGAEPEDPFGGETISGDTFGPTGADDFGGSDFGAGTFDDVRSDNFGSDLSDAGAGDSAQPAPEPTAPTAGTVADNPSPSVGEQVGNIAGNLTPFALLGFLAVIAIFAAVGLAVGRPTTSPDVLTRRGGVSRALAGRRTTPIPDALEAT